MLSSSKKKRAIVLLSGSGSNLQAFIDAVSSAKLSLDIALVISNKPEAYGLTRARKANIATCVIDHTQYPFRIDFDRELVKIIEPLKPDVIILAGFMRILSTEFTSKFSHKLLNIHPSLLPKYPGTKTHERALLAKDKEHGVSVHFVIADVDAGPIIAQGKFTINAKDTPKSLQQRAHKVEHQLYPLAVQWFIENRLSIIDNRVLLNGETSPLQLQSFSC